MSEPTQSVSLFRLRLRKFRRIKRGYYSLLLLVSAYALTFFLPFLMHSRAIAVYYEGSLFFPAFRTYFSETFDIGYPNVYLAETFGQTEVDGFPIFGETDYRALQQQFQNSDEGNWVLLPPIPYNPRENFLTLEGNPPHEPSSEHWMGTDKSARDMLVRLAYGFRISISFALIVTVVAYTVGTAIGALLGYFGRWVDMLGLRFVEIWSTIPFLYTVIIIRDLFTPSFLWLALILAAFGWIGISYYIRGEFYREKAKDYVAAAIAVGEGNTSIIFKHILPNALTPIIAFAPFAIVAMITALVSLDFLGYGLRPPTPSWGELLKQAKETNFREWHLVVFPIAAMAITLQLIVFIGEAVREAFDPKQFSRLR